MIPPRARLRDTFTCPNQPGRCRLTYLACLLRHKARVDHGPIRRGLPIHPTCAACLFGAEVRARFPRAWLETQDSTTRKRLRREARRRGAVTVLPLKRRRRVAATIPFGKEGRT